MFKRRACDHEISAVVTNSCAKVTPAPRRFQIEWQDPFAVEDQQPVEPSCERRRKAWIPRVLSSTALDLTDADDADEKIGRSLLFEPRYDPGVAPKFAQL